MSAIQVAVLGGDDIALTNGMQRTPGVIPVPTVPFATRSNPFADSILHWVVPGDPPTYGQSVVTNPNNTLFNAASVADMAGRVRARAVLPEHHGRRRDGD